MEYLPEFGPRRGIVSTKFFISTGRRWDAMGNQISLGRTWWQLGVGFRNFIVDNRYSNILVGLFVVFNELGLQEETIVRSIDYLRSKRSQNFVTVTISARSIPHRFFFRVSVRFARPACGNKFKRREPGFLSWMFGIHSRNRKAAPYEALYRVLRTIEKSHSQNHFRPLSERFASRIFGSLRFGSWNHSPKQFIRSIQNSNHISIISQTKQ